MEKVLEKWIENYELEEHMELLLEDEAVELTALDYHFKVLPLVVQPEILVWFDKGDIEGHVHLPLYPLCPNMGQNFIDTLNDNYNLYGAVFTILGANDGVIDADDWLEEFYSAMNEAEEEYRELKKLS